MENIQAIKQKTVVFQIMEQLKQIIASGELKPGDRVPNEYDLAKMFGVGRSSIREALKIFQYLGVVELQNPKGTYVNDHSKIPSEALLWSILLGEKDFKDLIELRLVLEHQGLWYLKIFNRSTYLVDKTVKQLNEEVSTMEEAIKTENNEKRVNADYNFHKHIINICKNEVFNNLYSTMKAFLTTEIDLAQKELVDKHLVIDNHKTLIDSILNDDYYTVTEKFRTHLKDIDYYLCNAPSIS